VSDHALVVYKAPRSPYPAELSFRSFAFRQQSQLRNLTVVAQRLAAQQALRKELEVAQAADIIWAITSPEVFSLLTVDRGWAKERYVHWLSDTLIRLLLP
jgi:hypothetical protein